MLAQRSPIAHKMPPEAPELSFSRYLIGWPSQPDCAHTTSRAEKHFSSSTRARPNAATLPRKQQAQGPMGTPVDLSYTHIDRTRIECLHTVALSRKFVTRHTG